MSLLFSMLAGFCDGLICGCFSYMYPTMEEMAYQINYVMAHFGLKTFIGFGVGAGAHVLAKFAISNPEKVDICHEEIGYHTKVHREFYTRKKEERNTSGVVASDTDIRSEDDGFESRLYSNRFILAQYYVVLNGVVKL